MPHRGPVLDGVLIDRPNRYRATVELDGRPVAAHVPNPGRMHELMVAGYPVQFVAVEGEHRRTAYDLQAVRLGETWVCLDNRLGGRLARLALEAHALDVLEPYERVEREVTCGASRLDFRLSGPAGVCWVEVKSCTLVLDGCGRFPDAPTLRGRRHVGELVARVAMGERAAVLFVIQRPDAGGIGPHDVTDPAFGDALRGALAAGVEAYAVVAEWTAAGLELRGTVPVVSR